MINKIKEALQNGMSIPTLVISALMTMSPEQYIALMGAFSALVTSMNMVCTSYCDAKNKRAMELTKHELEMKRYDAETEALIAAQNHKNNV